MQELINTGIMAILYFIAFIVQLAAWSPWYGYARGSNIAAGVSIKRQPNEARHSLSDVPVD